MLDSFYLDPNAVTGPDPLGILMVAVIAYFCGCFNGAVIVSKYILRDDVRNHGSGNAGLTNFYRTFGGPLTFVVILCDVLKAVVAVLLGGWLLGTVAGANGYAANERISSMWALSALIPADEVCISGICLGWGQLPFCHLVFLSRSGHRAPGVSPGGLDFVEAPEQHRPPYPWQRE